MFIVDNKRPKFEFEILLEVVVGRCRPIAKSSPDPINSGLALFNVREFNLAEMTHLENLPRGFSSIVIGN